MRSLADILDKLESSARNESVSLGGALDEIGMRSYAPLLLVPSMILVSPLSGIPGLPTIGASLIVLISAQKLMGRDHVWLPDWLKRRQIKGHRLKSAVNWLRRPAGWIDARTHQRLPMFVNSASNILTLLVIISICLVIPFLEILPMVTSLFATAISFFAIGLLARDGLFTLIGYIWVGGAGYAIWRLMT
ncbi:exopolysaccharide biosynthesis protein exod [Oceanicola sp. 22II-s10i]|nr:exopolysaccharide biosynthesis protein exod [Oceanicola sp. 22II-s10i]